MTIPQAPPPPSGFQPQNNVGALVRFVVHSYNPHAVTPFGARAEVVVDVDVLADSPLAGEGFTGIKLSGKLLAPQLGQVQGKEVFGRLAAKPGQNANPAIWLDVLRPGDEVKVNVWREEAARVGGNRGFQQHDYRNEPGWQEQPSVQQYVPPQAGPTSGSQTAANGGQGSPEGLYVPPTFGQQPAGVVQAPALPDEPNF